MSSLAIALRKWTYYSIFLDSSYSICDKISYYSSPFGKSSTSNSYSGGAGFSTISDEDPVSQSFWDLPESIWSPEFDAIVFISKFKGAKSSLLCGSISCAYISEAFNRFFLYNTEDYFFKGVISSFLGTAKRLSLDVSRDSLAFNLDPFLFRSSFTIAFSSLFFVWEYKSYLL